MTKTLWEPVSLVASCIPLSTVLTGFALEPSLSSFPLRDTYIGSESSLSESESIMEDASSCLLSSEDSKSTSSEIVLSSKSDPDRSSSILETVSRLKSELLSSSK